MSIDQIEHRSFAWQNTSKCFFTVQKLLKSGWMLCCGLPLQCWYFGMSRLKNSGYLNRFYLHRSWCGQPQLSFGKWAICKATFGSVPNVFFGV